MIIYLKALVLILAFSLGSLCVVEAEANQARDSAMVFEEADEAFVEGNFTRGERLLNELIAKRPGDFDLATQALHRICLSQYLELMDNDWPSQGYPNQMFNKAGRDHDKTWALISEYLREGFLEVGKFGENGERYSTDPRKSPFMLESLWRKVADFPLTPMENMSDEAAGRILTLRRSGYLEADDPAVIDASVLLIFLRRSQKRYPEAAQLVDDLVKANNQQIDWVLARAVFHVRIRSPRTASLFRELSEKFARSGVDPVVAKAARRAEALKIPWMKPITEVHQGQSWISQMIPDDQNQVWDRLAAGGVNGLENQIDLWIQATFSMEQSQVYLLRKDGTGSAMTWNVLDDQLKSLEAKTLQGLRKFQEERCRLDPRSSNLNEATQSEKLALFRRFPWAKTAHLGLMDYAQKELEAGRNQSARRAFRDLLEHAEDSIILGRSRVGTWLATAQGQEYEVLAKLLAEVDPEEKFPWMDRSATAREIKERLMKGVTSSATKKQAPTLSDLDIQFLKLPALPLWPQMNHRRSPGLAFVDLQSIGSRLLVSTRNVLAGYDGKNGSQPIWTDTFLGGQKDRSIGRPGSFRPIVERNRLYTRWGYGADPRKLIAMDIETREILWSQEIAGPHEARRRIPLGNPILSGGQIYVASAWDQHRSTGGYNLRLSSVDAPTGKINWRADLYVQTMQHFFEGVFGESLTVHDGAIYCSPSTGFLARFDARDGKMEWMYNYGSRSRNSLLADTLGTAPHIVGDVVVGLPRDTNVMFGLNRNTGEKLWQSSLLLPKKIIGSVDGKLLVHGVFSLAAVDAKTGKTHWEIPFPDKIFAQPTLQGSSVYLASGSNFYRYDAATGIEQETRPLPQTKNSIRKVSAIDNNLYLITNEPSAEKENSFVRKALGNAAWEITARDPKVYLPKENESTQGEILIHEDELLHCLEATPEGKVLWQRFVYPRPNEIFFVEGKTVLLYHKGRYDLYLKALDKKTGNLAWELTLLRLRAGHGAAIGRSGKYLYGKDNSDRFYLIDLDIGKVVLQNRMPRKNGHVKAGFGGGKVHFLVTPSYQKNLHWVQWDVAKNEVAGINQVLRGRDGDSQKAFDNDRVEFAKFGEHSCYFISRQQGPNTGYVAYRADYKDKSTHLVGKNMRNLKFEPPFLFMQGQETEQNKKTRTHNWAVQREDNPNYAHSLDLPHSWYHKPTFVNGHVLEVRTPIRNQNPYTVRVHDLDTKKELFTHTSENTERMGGIPAGPDRILVYDWKRNVRNTPMHFKLTLYDLNTGLASPTMEIDYWKSTTQHPNEIRVAGNLILINDRYSVKAWSLKL